MYGQKDSHETGLTIQNFYQFYILYKVSQYIIIIAIITVNEFKVTSVVPT